MTAASNAAHFASLARTAAQQQDLPKALALMAQAIEEMAKAINRLPTT